MEAAEQGKGVVDMIDSRAARKETPAWWELMRWIDAQPKSTTLRSGESRVPPKAAARRSLRNRSLTA
jgi:hypothetical protein